MPRSADSNDQSPQPGRQVARSRAHLRGPGRRGSAHSGDEHRLPLFQNYLARRGLKWTRQRETIARSFWRSGHHISAEELYDALRAEGHRSIGLATVYRTLKLLCECEMAEEKSFRGGIIRFEPKLHHEHHDHLICEVCGAIVEFHNPAIERLQREVSERHRFMVRSHRLELYGLCPGCAKRTRKPGAVDGEMLT